MSNTGRLYLDVLSANANFVSASGHLYGLDQVVVPPVAGVPEPSTYALFGSGFGMLLWWMRRRKALTSEANSYS